MKKIMIIDTNYGFTSDIESRLILEDVDNMDIITRNNINTIHQEIEQEQPDELLISSNLINSHPDWDFGVPVRTYAKNSEGLQLSNQKGFESYGVITGAGDLLKAIEGGKIVTVEESPVIEEKPPKPTPIIPKHAPKPAPKPTRDILDDDEDALEDKFKDEENDYDEDDVDEDDADLSSYEKRVKAQNKPQPPKKVPSVPYESAYEESPSDSQYEGFKQGDIKARLKEAKRREEEERRRQAALNNPKKEQSSYEVEKDMGNVMEPAKVITVYSAKGGVGKTTLSCELATFLSLTAHGRGHLKVCVADFNIDFGDVMNTLNFDANKACMTVWAADIRERLASKEKPEDIKYTAEQISVWLQEDERTGLCALLAPMTNEDSMDISEIELEIMLNNLINYGGFDYVVCDTGNNTRDSSFIPLEKSDEVVLVLTQSVNTANCNAGFLSTMRKIGFDMDKIKIVINKTQASKSVGISVDELIEAFINPNTGRPFEVLGILKDSNDVKNANNIGEPLVYNAGHDFTRGVGEIAAKLMGQNFVLEQPKKKGFLSRLLKK